MTADVASPQQVVVWRLAVRVLVGGFLGVLVVMTFFTLVAIAASDPTLFRHWALFLLTGFLAGTVTSSIVIVEALARRRTATWRRDLAAALAALVLVFVGLWAGALETIYTLGARSGDVRRGLLWAIAVNHDIWTDDAVLTIFFIMATPLAALTVARLRDLDLRRATSFTIVMSSLLAAPALILYPSNRVWSFLWQGTGPPIAIPEWLFVAALLVFTASHVPLAFRIGDRLERRLLPAGL